MAWNEEKWEKKFQSFALLLKKQGQQEEKMQQFCKICGRSRILPFYDDGGIHVCAGCRNNRVSRLQDAEGILYLTYGNFSRMFKVGFRYPNLFFLETEVNNIYELDSRRGNYNGLVINTGQAGYDFTLGIAKNIPSAFLEEIFVFSFSKMYLKEKIEEWENEDDAFWTPIPFFWDDIYQDPKELMKAVQKSLRGKEKLLTKELYERKKKRKKAKRKKQFSEMTLYENDINQNESGDHELNKNEKEAYKKEWYEEKYYEKEQLGQEWYTKINRERKRCEKAIMICYLYDNGREEQANVLKERLQEQEYEEEV